MPRPTILGVVGDSAAGKTTLTRGLVRILGEDKVTHVCTDDYHRYDRKQRAERNITPLDPECNYMDIMGHDLAPPRAGEAILKPVYRHADGTFGPPVYVGPQTFTVIEGLLGYYTPEMRDIYDVRVFLAPPEDLRRKWKVDRDCSRRGYTTDQVLAELDRREADSAAYIRPQERYADLVVSFMPSDDGRPPTTSTPSCCFGRVCPIPTFRRSSATARGASRARARSRSPACGFPATSSASGRPSSRRRSGTASTSRPTCARSGSASSRSGPSSTGRSHSRSSSC